MILIHLILGIILGKLTNNYLPFILGSIIPDIDHLYIIIKHKLYKNNFKSLLDSIKNEERYKIRYKTPLIHSLLGLIIISLLFFIINKNQLSLIYFSSAYFLHLIMDWFDKDIKYYLYPLKIKFKGSLEIWSKMEIFATIITIILLTILLIA